MICFFFCFFDYCFPLFLIYQLKLICFEYWRLYFQQFQEFVNFFTLTILSYYYTFQNYIMGIIFIKSFINWVLIYFCLIYFTEVLFIKVYKLFFYYLPIIMRSNCITISITFTQLIQRAFWTFSYVISQVSKLVVSILLFLYSCYNLIPKLPLHYYFIGNFIIIVI